MINKDSPGRPAPLLGLVLNGGQSRRMGRPKGDLMLGQERLRDRAERLLQAVTESVWQSVGDRPPQGPRDLPDQVPGAGPLGGLHAAQRQRPGAAWLVLAVDLPAATKDLLRQLVNARGSAFAAVAFAQGDRFEPTCALYEPASAAQVRRQIRSGDFALQHTLRALPTQRLPHPGPALLNINTPEDWRAFQGSGGGPHSAKSRS